MKEMNKKTMSYYCFRVIRWLVWLFYLKMKVVGAENLPADASVIVGNHAQMNGPICAELYFPGNRRTWCNSEMMHCREVPAYAREDFWRNKPKYSKWFYWLLSYIIAPISACVFNNAYTIPVYHDNRLLRTFKQTISCLQEGANIIIFPESREKYNAILNQFQDKYIDLAKGYYKRTGKELNFVPLYIAPALKTMYIGKPIAFDPHASIEQERTRITEYLMGEITAISENLPRHRVVPYDNISKKDYPVNCSQEARLP